MILPHPESDLTLNIMVLGVEIIKSLTNRNFVLIEDVLVEFLNKGIKRTPEMFFNSLTFLYSFGLIEQQDYKIKLNPQWKKQMGLLE